MNSARIKGFATKEGTDEYRKKCALLQDDFFNETKDGLFLSSIGIGTYLGDASDVGDRKYYDSITYGIQNGINVVDTAITYRSMRSEKVVGSVIKDVSSRYDVGREHLFISTKGGVIHIPGGQDRKEYITNKVVNGLLINPGSIIDRRYCIEPVFLEREIEQSRENLGLETIDCYFIHNPETALKSLSREAFYRKLYEIFELMEEKVAQACIRYYGIASWTGFRVDGDCSVFLDLPRIYSIASEITETHHFRFIQVPLSIGMPVLFGKKQHVYHGQNLSVFEAAGKLGLDVFVSGSVYEGKLEELMNLCEIFRSVASRQACSYVEQVKVSFPKSSISLVQLFKLLLRLRDGNLDLVSLIKSHSHHSGKELYPKALDMVRSLDGITTALTSCDESEYVRENLALSHVPKCDVTALRLFWTLIST